MFYCLRYWCVCFVAIFYPALHGAVAPAYGSQPLNVVVTLPVLKDWAQQIGGPHVGVTSLMTGYESEHTYSPKPSDLVAVRKAQVLIEVGAGLEVWVSTLVKNAGNPRLLIVTASRGIELLEDHDDVAGMSPGAGSAHSHSHGNPHVWLDPNGASVMIRHIADAFIATDPAGRARRFDGVWLRCQTGASSSTIRPGPISPATSASPSQAPFSCNQGRNRRHAGSKRWS